MSFRKYGGINYASSNNIVKSNYTTSSNLYVSELIGLENSKIKTQSHIDMSNNSIMNTGSIYFSDGSVQTTAYQSTYLLSDFVIKKLTVTEDLKAEGPSTFSGDIRLNTPGTAIYFPDGTTMSSSTNPWGTNNTTNTGVADLYVNDIQASVYIGINPILTPPPVEYTLNVNGTLGVTSTATFTVISSPTTDQSLNLIGPFVFTNNIPTVSSSLLPQNSVNDTQLATIDFVVKQIGTSSLWKNTNNLLYPVNNSYNLALGPQTNYNGTDKFYVSGTSSFYGNVTINGTLNSSVIQSTQGQNISQFYTNTTTSDTYFTSSGNYYFFNSNASTQTNTVYMGNLSVSSSLIIGGINILTGNTVFTGIPNFSNGLTGSKIGFKPSTPIYLNPNYLPSIYLSSTTSYGSNVMIFDNQTTQGSSGIYVFAGSSNNIGNSVVYAGKFIGDVQGNVDSASKIAISNQSSNNNYYLTFTPSASNSSLLYTNNNIYYNPSSNYFAVNGSISSSSGYFTTLYVGNQNTDSRYLFQSGGTVNGNLNVTGILSTTDIIEINSGNYISQIRTSSDNGDTVIYSSKDVYLYSVNTFDLTNLYLNGLTANTITCSDFTINGSIQISGNININKVNFNNFYATTSANKIDLFTGFGGEEGVYGFGLAAGTVLYNTGTNHQFYTGSNSTTVGSLISQIDPTGLTVYGTMNSTDCLLTNGHSSVALSSNDVLNAYTSSATTYFYVNRQAQIGLYNISGSGIADIWHIDSAGNFVTSGIVEPTYIKLNSAPGLVYGNLDQGAYITWNSSGGTGETDFINSRGTGPGGFYFYNAGSNPNGGNPVNLAVIGPNGLYVNGAITSDGGSSTFYVGGGATNTSFNSTALTNPPVQNGIGSGSGDGADSTTFDNAIYSWWGTGFVDTCFKTCNIFFDHRAGQMTSSHCLLRNGYSSATLNPNDVMNVCTTSATTYFYVNKAGQTGLWNSSGTGTADIWHIDTYGNISTAGSINCGWISAYRLQTADNCNVGNILEVTNDASIGGNLVVSSDVTATSFNATSDYRIKEQIKPIEYTIDNLNPITYYNNKSQKQDIGLIAHELQEEIPCLVTGEKDGEELQTINYIGLIGVLIKEVQDLKKENASLKESIMDIYDILNIRVRF